MPDMHGAAPEVSLDEPRNRRTASRSRLYALFAEALSYPEGSTALRLLDGDLLGEIRDHISALDSPVSCPTEWPVPSGPDAIREIQRIYSELFDVASGSPAVSLLERRYGEVPEQKLWQELLAFYAHFGLDFSNGKAAEQPDHVLTELAFLHYLSFLEAGATDGLDDLRRGQRDFLKLHAAQWITQITEKFDDSPQHHPYAEIFELLGQFVTADLAQLENDMFTTGT